MPSATYIALANLTLTGSDASIDFTSIPATYRDLILVMQTIGTQGSYDRVRINGETGSIYTRVRMIANSAGASGQSNTLNAIDLNDINTSAYSTTIMHFMDAGATDKHKAVLVRTSQLGSAESTAHGVRVATTARITSITVFPGAGSFAAGSNFALYGIAS